MEDSEDVCVHVVEGRTGAPEQEDEWERDDPQFAAPDEVAAVQLG